MAGAREQRGDGSGAVDAYGHALAARPGFAEALAALLAHAYARYDAADDAAALPALDVVQRHHPTHEAALSGLGHVLMRQGDYAAAAAVFRQLSRAARRHSPAAGRPGLCLPSPRNTRRGGEAGGPGACNGAPACRRVEPARREPHRARASCGCRSASPRSLAGASRRRGPALSLCIASRCCKPSCARPGRNTAGACAPALSPRRRRRRVRNPPGTASRCRAAASCWASSWAGRRAAVRALRPARASDAAKVSVQAATTLHRLLRGLPATCEVVSPTQALRADFQCALMDLPDIFATGLADIPAAVPYLRTDPAKVAQWAARLRGSRQRLVGVACSGNPKHTNDGNRSIALEKWASVLQSYSRFISLQADLRASDRAAAASLPLDLAPVSEGATSTTPRRWWMRSTS